MSFMCIGYKAQCFRDSKKVSKSNYIEYSKFLTASYVVGEVLNITMLLLALIQEVTKIWPILAMISPYCEM